MLIGSLNPVVLIEAKRGKSNMNKQMVCVRVQIYGKVQGVFYRLSTQKTAQAAGVTGWVRNMSDGSVEAFFEGDQAAVDTVLKWCHGGPARAHVERVIVRNEPYSSRYTDFTVRSSSSA